MLLALIATLGSAHAEPAGLLDPDPARQCQTAILAAEHEHRLPPALMGAIARVESGRPREDGSVAPWPWTINAEGQGRFFESKQAAIAAVRALQARGVRLIDVGCMQVNLLHHPRAFANLEEAFDPVANARYAGLFLTQLYATTRDWVKAAGNYHSQTAELAETYRARVLAAWPGMARRLAEERQRQALVNAWQSTRAPAGGLAANGFMEVARELAQRPAAAPPRGATHVVVARQGGSRRSSTVEEVAEAGRR
jgi:Transglycosylase SLT domain